MHHSKWNFDKEEVFWWITTSTVPGMPLGRAVDAFNSQRECWTRDWVFDKDGHRNPKYDVFYWVQAS